jgi:hypothetical protein
MNSSRFLLLLASILFFLMTFAAEAQERPKIQTDGPRRMIMPPPPSPTDWPLWRPMAIRPIAVSPYSNLFGRGDKSEMPFHQFSTLKEQSGQQAGRTGQMRPLGRYQMVDRNGIIWMGEAHVGLWGVDGSLVPAFPTAE